MPFDIISIVMRYRNPDAEEGRLKRQLQADPANPLPPILLGYYYIRTGRIQVPMTFSQVRLLHKNYRPIDSRIAIPALIATAQECQQWRARAEAINVLGIIGVGAEVIPVLIESIYDDSLGVQGAAIKALGLIEATSAIPALLEKLREMEIQDRDRSSMRNLNNRSAIFRALGQIGDVSAIPVLLRVTQEGYPLAKTEANEAIQIIRQRNSGEFCGQCGRPY